MLRYKHSLKSMCPLWTTQQKVRGNISTVNYTTPALLVVVCAWMLLSLLTAGADYRALNNVVVTFEPGTSSVSVNVTTIDDNVAERDETLHVTFDIPRTEAAANVMRGAVDRTEVVIESNDGVCLSVCMFVVCACVLACMCAVCACVRACACARVCVCTNICPDLEIQLCPSPSATTVPLPFCHNCAPPLLPLYIQNLLLCLRDLHIKWWRVMVCLKLPWLQT